MLIDYQQANIYQQDAIVLSDVDFHVDNGEFIYIIGKVGSGKSSLLKTFYCEHLSFGYSVIYPSNIILNITDYYV